MVYLRACLVASSRHYSIKYRQSHQIQNRPVDPGEMPKTCLWGNMRSFLPSAILVAIAAAFLGTQYSKEPRAEIEKKTIVDELNDIVHRSLVVVAAQAQQTQWQDLHKQGTPTQIITFLSENPSSPHRDVAMAHLQDLLANETITRSAPDLLGLAPATPTPEE